MIKVKLNRIPTGISSLDTIIHGGFPSGSMVLLVGDVGAGNTEFAYTSAIMLSSLKNEGTKYNAAKKHLESFMTERDVLKIPGKICYISFVHSKKEILMELERSFPPEFSETLSNNLFFKDFSSIYFKTSISPALNVEGNTDINILKSVGGVKGLLKELVYILDSNAPHNLVIIDSLTNLIRICNRSMDWQDLISFLEDLQQRSKKWDGLVYLPLGKNIFGIMKEEEVMDVADGVLMFEWVQEGFSRQQTMYIKKFRGLMPHLTKDNIMRFDTKVTNTDGFVVVNVKRISGRK
ncbi:MAG: RAD55 family ATPase [Candidatus Methanoperedens sp.]|nr:RAD55 family ATPase [Candidatus Methanoperedens sp.]MCZ7371432.1 RAD55 family ATPase [Candidatus Methanoperedens sp.]